jgi:hypothetical protein
MVELFVSMSKLFVGFVCILGPVALLLALLHARDRREAALSTTVLRELNSPDLRGLFSVKAKSRSIGADAVVVDLWGCSREQVWDAMEKLSVKLPSHVRLEVNGLSDCRMRSAWTLTASRRVSSAALCP